MLRTLPGSPTAPALLALAAVLLAGRPFQLSVEVRNEATGAGDGLVTVRLNGEAVDARASPDLEPGRKAVLVMTLIAPDKPGPAIVEVGDLKLVLPVGQAAQATSCTLEQRLARPDPRSGAAEHRPVPAPANGASEPGSDTVRRTPRTGPLPLALATLGVALLLAPWRARRNTFLHQAGLRKLPRGPETTQRTR